MFDLYFDEFDPVKRKEILDSLKPEEGEEKALEQLRALFSLRYKENRKGGYDDTFLGAMMILRSLSDKTYKTGKRKMEKETRKAMQILCLDRKQEFSSDLLFSEMYQLIYYYMSLCMEDHHFGSVLFDFGRMSDENITRKIQTELFQIRDTVSSYAEEENDYPILARAIEEAIRDRLKTAASTSTPKQGVRKVDQR